MLSEMPPEVAKSEVYRRIWRHDDYQADTNEKQVTPTSSLVANYNCAIFCVTSSLLGLSCYVQRTSRCIPSMFTSNW